jgi:hypothetical protein
MSESTEGVGAPTPQPVYETPANATLVRLEWFRTETFSAEVEVVDYDPDADDMEERLEDIIHNLDRSDEAAAFEGCSEFEITRKKVIRPAAEEGGTDA